METRFYGAGLAKLDVGTELPGNLIVVEGADGVGRSTHIELLQGWLEGQGFAVASTGLVRSALTRRGIELAKEGHSFDRTTMALFYATDLADRLEHEIIPALRSGFVVLADRYIYTTMARGSVRGLDREWLARLYGFALMPRRVFFLRLDPDELIRRTLRRGGELDYWESGRDIGLAPDLYTSFRKYQTLILGEFDRMAEQYGFTTIDASRTVEEVQAELRREVANLLDPSLLTPAVDVADD
ncbi:MAG TPA: thymidylate kinase [Thermoanaerobaculaceae bacterium]|nr:thymidylate kinase [Thermoanaerobaculaceae bacterium]